MQDFKLSKSISRESLNKLCELKKKQSRLVTATDFNLEKVQIEYSEISQSFNVFNLKKCSSLNYKNLRFIKEKQNRFSKTLHIVIAFILATSNKIQAE